MTMSVPSAIDNATILLGFFTAAGGKPMLFQASAENSEPTWATPKATNKPKAPEAAVTVGRKPFRKLAPGAMDSAPRIAHRWLKLSAMAAGFLPSRTHTTISPARANVLALVKT